MATNLAPVIRQRYFDANGNPLAGGKLYTYQSGTSTPQATYTDAGGGSPNTNPVVLDANGEANVWLDVSRIYKFVLKDLNDVPLWTVDGVSGTHSLVDGSVSTPKLVDDAVTAAKLRDSDSVDSDRAVTTNHIRDLAVTAAKLAANSVTTDKIPDGNVTTSKIPDEAITQAKRAALGQQVSGDCLSFSTVSTSFVDVTGLSVTITTTGRPVIVAVVPVGAGNDSHISAYNPTGGYASGSLKILKDGADFGIFQMKASVSGDGIASVEVNQLPSLVVFDVPTAATHIYKIQAAAAAGTSIGLLHCKLVAFEL